MGPGRCRIASISEQKNDKFDVIAAGVLFLASAAMTVWQNSRLTVLWDASYILENASRIAGGDVPYRDFPFPYPPLTFAGQALIIKLFGRAFWHHIAYAAIACGAASALTYAIARTRVRPLIALLLALPLALLGIYCIFPHPFYDPDACLAILGIVALLVVRDDSLLAGAACVVPLLIKQNIGFAFLAAAVLLHALARRWRVVAGAAMTSAVAAALVALLFGFGNYVRWTIDFAAARRLPPLSDVAGMFADPVVWWCAAAIAGGALLMRRLSSRRAARSERLRWLGAILLVAPWIWMAARFYLSDDPVEREINLLRLWPAILIAAVVVAPRRMTFLLLAAIAGAFLSQGNWGSTYGIWPLLVLLLALIFEGAGEPARAHVAAAAVIALLTLHSAWPYVANNDRLTYTKWSEGPLRASSLPALRGLRARGDWLPQFEELVAFAGANIPRGDGILFLPGEDLFYFATGRRPHFPVLMFDRTVNPYSPAEIASLADARGIRWLIVKRRLVINGDPYTDQAATIALLRPRFAPFARLANYDVYRR